MRKSATNGILKKFQGAFIQDNVPVMERPTDSFIVFGRPDIGEQERRAVEFVLKSGWLSTGPVVKEFEAEFGKFMGAGYPVAVSSCTDGLILSLMVSCIGEGMEVITTPLTFAATINAILAVGAKPVFVDVRHDGQMDENLIEAVITNRTRAILPVHYTGAPCHMNVIRDIASRRGLKVIEDAAHSFGGTYNGQPLGTLGDFGCFSFYATKNITCGEGGMVVCKSADMAEKIRILSMQGLSSGAHRRYTSDPIRTYEVTYAGRKSNLSDIHAAVGLAQLRRWTHELQPKREAVWRIYEKAFGEKEKGHSQHLFTVRHPNRDGLRAFLHERGIGTGLHFKPLHLEPGYKFLGYEKGQFPKAEKIGEIVVSLPVSSTMISEDAERVVREVKNFGEGK